MRGQNPGKLNIILAVYGLKIVTEQINALLNEGDSQTLSFIVNNRAIGMDGWRGQRKSITIIYNYDGGNLLVAAAREDDILTIKPGNHRKPEKIIADDSTDSQPLTVLAATYGPDDVTHKIKNLISPLNTLAFTVSNTLLSDTWYGIAKTLVIVLGSGKEVKAVEIFTEREKCYLDLNDMIAVL